jgi:glycosyltransferase involved in cell wall biosynthesis
MSAQHGVSIVICTYNGSQKLPETLRHIALQEIPEEISWELIIVNNSSTDNTAAVATTEWRKYANPGSFTVITEPKQGLSYARDRGFNEARFDYILLCDDDNWLEKDFIAIARNIMMQNPKIAVLGGLGEPVFEAEPPPWILDNPRMIAVGPQAPASGKVESNKVSGAGCIIRKSAYSQLKQSGFKGLLSDRKGSELSSGGDYELCYALAVIGYEIWYSDELKFKHFITKERLTWEYCLRYIRESTRCFDVLTSYKMILKNRKIDVFAYAMMMNIFYHFRQLIPITLKRITHDTNSPAGRNVLLRYIVFKTEILSYVTNYKTIYNNYKKGIELKNSVQQYSYSEKALQPEVVNNRNT